MSNYVTLLLCHTMLLCQSISLSHYVHYGDGDTQSTTGTLIFVIAMMECVFEYVDFLNYKITISSSLASGTTVLYVLLLFNGNLLHAY